MADFEDCERPREQLLIGETVPEDLFRPRLGGLALHVSSSKPSMAIWCIALCDQARHRAALIENVPLEYVLARRESTESVHNSACRPLWRWRDRADSDASPCRPTASRVVSPPLGRGSSTSPTSCRRPRLGDVRSSLDGQRSDEYLSSQLGEVETTLHDASAILRPRHRAPRRQRGATQLLRHGEGRHRRSGRLRTAAPARDLIAGRRQNEIHRHSKWPSCSRRSR